MSRTILHGSPWTTIISSILTVLWFCQPFRSLGAPFLCGPSCDLGVTSRRSALSPSGVWLSTSQARRHAPPDFVSLPESSATKAGARAGGRPRPTRTWFCRFSHPSPVFCLTGGRGRGRRAAGSSGRDLACPQMSFGQLWASSGAALGQLWASSGPAVGKLWGSSGAALGQLALLAARC